VKPADKKRAEKTAGKKTRQPQIEYAGNFFTTNFYIKLGMLREELVALKQISQLFEQRKSRTAGHALHLVVSTALLHWDKLEPYVFSDQKYVESEGFEDLETYRHDAIPRKFQPVKDGGAR
jgi:hypothetical protein